MLATFCSSSILLSVVFVIAPSLRVIRLLSFNIFRRNGS